MKIGGDIMSNNRKIKVIISINGHSHELYTTMDEPAKVMLKKDITFPKDEEIHLVVRDAHVRRNHPNKGIRRYPDRFPYKTPRRSIKKDPNRKRFGGGRGKPEFDE